MRNIKILLYTSFLPFNEEINKQEKVNPALIDLTENIDGICYLRALHVNLFPFRQLYNRVVPKDGEGLTAGKKINILRTLRIPILNIILGNGLKNRILELSGGKQIKVISHLYDSIIPLSRLRLKNIERFAVLHASDIIQLGNKVRAFFLIKALKKYKKIAFRSRSIQIKFNKLTGNRFSNHDLVVFSGVGLPDTLKISNRNNSRIVFCTAARFVKLKNIDLVMRALSRLPDSIEWEYHLLGSGSQENYLKQLSFELGINNRIIWHGWKDNKSVFAILAQSDIYLMPSNPETLGVIFFEALLCGNLILGARDSGVHGMIDEKYAEFSDISVESIYLGINKLIIKRKDISHKEISKYTKENFSKKAAQENYLKLINEK